MRSRVRSDCAGLASGSCSWSTYHVYRSGTWNGVGNPRIDHEMCHITRDMYPFSLLFSRTVKIHTQLLTPTKIIYKKTHIQKDCHGPSHPSLLTGLPHPNESDEQPPASVGGQGWRWAFPKVKIPQTSDFPSLLCSPPNTYACI